MNKQNYIYIYTTAIVILIASCFLIYQNHYLKYEEKQLSENQRQLSDEIKLTIEQNKDVIYSENLGYNNKKIDNYVLFEIEGFETLYESNKPMIPFRQIEVDVPLDAEVYVNVDFSNKIKIKNTNIPAYRPPSPMPAYDWESVPDSGPIDCPKDISIFPEKNFDYRKFDRMGYSVVHVFVYPLTYDAVNNQAILSQEVHVQVNYNSSKKGIIKNFVVPHTAIQANVTFRTSTTIKNIVSNTEKFEVLIEIRSIGGNIVRSEKSSFELDGYEKEELYVDIASPSQQGSYTIKTKSYNDNQEIGSLYEYIGIIPYQYVIIDSLNVSKEVSKSAKYTYATFNVKIKNPTDESFRAYVDLYIYHDTDELTKRPQMFVDLEPYETKEITDHWFIDHLDPGFYFVHAIASVGDYTVSSDDSFEITQ